MSGRDAPGGEGAEATFQRARDAALRFLGYRARSEAEVRRRLLRRYSCDVVERVIGVLNEQSLLDDWTFAQQWRATREAHRPRAGRLVRQELRQRGVPAEVVRAALADFDDEANAYHAGLKLAHRLNSRNYGEEELRRRLWSHLQRRGFASGQIREVVERLVVELGADLLHGQDHAQDDEEHSKESQISKADWSHH